MYLIGTFQTTFFVLYLIGTFCNIANMDNKTIRYNNARSLIKKVGSLEAFAEKIDRAPTQCSAFAGSNPRKGIGDSIARLIEERFDLPHGWMDQNNSNVEGKEVIGAVGTGVSASQDVDRHQALAGLLQATEGFSASDLAELQAQAEIIRRRKSGAF